jgi:hypothetical protein
LKAASYRIYCTADTDNSVWCACRPKGIKGKEGKIMTMTSTTVIILVVAAIVAAAAGIYIWLRARRQRLQRAFGPEYSRTVHELGQYKAEFELDKRAKRVEKLQIRELSEADRERFSNQWQSVQSGFVDDPAKALKDADLLVAAVMNARGYPVRDFEQCAKDISVDHGIVVDNYRAAHSISIRCARGEATTEDLRQAMIHYRTLFDDLLPVAVEVEPRQLRRAV